MLARKLLYQSCLAKYTRSGFSNELWTLTTVSLQAEVTRLFEHYYDGAIEVIREDYISVEFD